MKNKALRITLSVVFCLLALGVLTAILTVMWVTQSPEYVEFDISKLNDINNSITVFDNNGNVIDMTIYLDKNKHIELSSLPQHTKDAFVSVEDKRFYSHHGVDYKRIGGAILHNLKAGDFKEGASTISQQLIKNTHLDNSKTIKRKINEIILTNELEKNFSKDKILEMYLNTIYFGENAYGIENASNLYFSKSAEQLTLSESALLAGIIKAPNTYSPLKNIDKCLERRNLVLSTMLKNSYITEAEYNEAIRVNIVCNSKNDAPLCKDYSYGVIKEACELLQMTPMQLLNSNLTIHTYFDQQCQDALERVVNSDNTLDIHQNKPELLAIVSQRETNGVKAFYCRGKGELNEKKQVGSTAKPFAVYAPSIEKRQITSASLVLDEKTSFGNYIPRNYNEKYFGWTTVKNAVANSLNVVALKVLNNLGPDVSVSYLRKMNFQIDDAQNLSMALGNINGGVNCRELLQAYNTLSNNGISNTTKFIKSIEINQTELYSRRLENRKVFSPETAFLMTDMLKYAVTNGTARNLNNTHFQVAAKTGTVGDENGNTEALICGYTSEDSFIFWLSDREVMPNFVTGGSVPASIAAEFLSDYYKNQCKHYPCNFEIPSTVIGIEIDYVDLLTNQQLTVANSLTSPADKEIFYFSHDNCPKTHSRRNIEEKLNLEINPETDKIVLKVPKCNCQVNLYKIDSDGNKQLLSHDGNTCIDRNIESGQIYYYYVELVEQGTVLAQSKTYSVKIPCLVKDNEYETDVKKENNDKGNNPLKFWYLPIR